MNAKLDPIKTALDAAQKAADALAKKEFAHCPAAIALGGRIANASEMLAALDKQAETLPAPAPAK